jgi:cysteine desulfurase
VRVYLDHNATTPLRGEVRELLLMALDRLRGNPSSVHASGRAARQMLDEARERCAAALGVREDELAFTSGGTESNNLALRGALALRPGAGLVTTAGEHASVLEPARRLAEEGRALELVPLDREGRVDPGEVAAAAQRARAGLVSVAAANNEIGTLGPLAEVGAALARGSSGPRPLLHTDAVQALGRVPVELEAWGVDLATFSAHKLGGPVGVGLLWHRRGAALAPHHLGGEQEDGLRPGTENVAGAVAAALAVELAVLERATFASRLRELEGLLWSPLQAAVPDAVLLGPPLGSPLRLPGTLDVVLPGVEAKVLVARLDVEGLEVSAGSACASGSLEPSHVLLALGLSERDARAGLRLSLGRSTTCAEVRQAVDILVKVAAGPGARR